MFDKMYIYNFVTCGFFSVDPFLEPGTGEIIESSGDKEEMDMEKKGYGETLTGRSHLPGRNTLSYVTEKSSEEI